MHVHEEGVSNILGGEPSEVDLVKAAGEREMSVFGSLSTTKNQDRETHTTDEGSQIFQSRTTRASRATTPMPTHSPRLSSALAKRALIDAASDGWRFPLLACDWWVGRESRRESASCSFEDEGALPGEAGG